MSTQYGDQNNYDSYGDSAGYAQHDAYPQAGYDQSGYPQYDQTGSDQYAQTVSGQYAQTGYAQYGQDPYAQQYAVQAYDPNAYAGGYAQVPAATAAQPQGNNAMGITSMSLGLGSILVTFIPIIRLMTPIMLIVGLILGFVGLAKDRSKGFAVAGLIINALLMLAGLALLIFIVIVGVQFFAMIFEGV